MESFTIVTSYYKGDYADTFKIFDEVEYRVELDGIDAQQHVGIYHDDPSHVAVEDLRSDIGVIVQSDSDITLSQNYQIMTIPARDVVVIDFPYVTPLSIYAGIKNAHPAMTKYMTEKGYSLDVPRMEIYDPENKVIKYIAEIQTKETDL